jgi:hypothetical protein
LDNPLPSLVTYSSTALSAAGAVLVGPYWIGNHRSGIIHITSTATGSTVQVQLSNDQVTWFQAACITVAGAASQQTSLVAIGASVFTTGGALYARVITNTAITAGTLAFNISFNTTFGAYPQVPTTQLAVTGVAQNSTGGASNANTYLAAATTNLTLIKSSAGCLNSVWGQAVNSGATGYLKVFNASSTASVTMGTTVPILNVGIAHPNSVSFNCGMGIKFTTGIVIAITKNAALLDATAPTAGDTLWNLSWA